MFSDLTAEQSRQIIDAEQVFATLRDAKSELNERYAGSMFWARSRGRRYLRRTIKKVTTSLGLEDEGTQATYEAFVEGRSRAIEIRDNCRKRLEDMARVNRALRIGRVPNEAARLLRRLDDAGILGRQIKVVGTNALFAYEAAAAVRLQSDILATGDIDFLFDARRRLRLLGEGDQQSLLKVLQKADRSFKPRSKNAYSAANSRGYMVDLIAPISKQPMQPGANERPNSIAALGGKVEDDLVAVAVDGLIWLENAPSFEQIAFGDDGMPVRIVTIDPRIFAAHKLWLSARADRERIKRGRDHQQALAAYLIARDYLGLRFDDREALAACPGQMIAALDDAFGEAP